jgi:hypothetical protein
VQVAGEKPEGIVEHNLGAVEYCITALAGRKPEDDRNSQQQYSGETPEEEAKECRNSHVFIRKRINCKSHFERDPQGFHFSRMF